MPVVAQFGFNPDTTLVERLGNGHINQTLLVSSGKQKIVLQQINDAVFPEPLAVTSNAQKICLYLNDRARANKYSMHAISCIPAVSGEFSINHQGKIWRALSFVENCHSPEQVVTEEQAFDTAHAFGTFAHAFTQFEASSLQTIIPNFHNLSVRFEQLDEAIQSDLVQRVAQCKSDIEFAKQQSSLIEQVEEALASCPIRVTHNDTKINNLLVDDFSHKPVAVVDLDTCMPGYVMHDFGDMVRASCSNLAEDDNHVSAMRIKTDVVKAMTQGYLTAWQGELTSQEVDSLWVGVKVMPLMLGIRFLTDYINGDIYFATKRPEQNLHRAQNQLAVFKNICLLENDLKSAFIVEEPSLV